MRGVALEVAERERLRVRAAPERDPGEATDGAARAVAAGQEAGTELLGAPILITSMPLASRGSAAGRG